ncbi:rRNA maturation RNase YbeY [Heliorestis acidaminivorans]|uniref:Endoribonuclease YbeY n=1 Tax=Heliorestis acidaminivorans TaxID=553427 RepID=A0A6I0EY86_9FIRM|nr:rRNA maturation RNase YbeY [Heliorestis acidaminivorans]KAB2952280.1 rRNA maturation RNase YbeY [Heliorestis acidaminivorans]
MELFIVNELAEELEEEKEESWQLLLEQLAFACLEEVEYPVDDVEISLLLTNDHKIKELNKSYRNIDKATDVLSFAMEEQSDEELDFDDPTEGQILGDIVISLDRAKEQAEEYGHTLERELGFLFVHGMFHLLGYDHETEEEKEEMRVLEEKVLNAHGLSRDEG